MARTKMPSRRRKTTARRTKRKVSASRKNPGLAKASLRYRTITTTYATALNRCWKKVPASGRKGLKTRVESFKKVRAATAAARALFRRYQSAKGKHSKAFLSKKRAALIKFRELTKKALAKAKALLKLVRSRCYRRNIVALHKRSKKTTRRRVTKRKVTKRKVTKRKVSKRKVTKRKVSKRKVTKRRTTRRLRWGTRKPRNTNKFDHMGVEWDWDDVKRPRSTGSKTWGRKARRSYADWEPLHSGDDYSPVDWATVRRGKAKRRKCHTRRLRKNGRVYKKVRVCRRRR